MLNKIKSNGYLKALLFLIGGAVLQITTTFIIQKDIYTGIMIVIPYIIGLIFAIYGIHIFVNKFFKQPVGDCDEEIYKRIMAEK